MLMRVQETIVDYNRVPDHHRAIHERLENWATWVRPRAHGWQTAPMFRMYQSKARQWEAPVIQNTVNTLDAMKLEKAVAALPDKHRDAIRWSYVKRSNPIGMAQKLAVSKQGLADLVDAGRTMLKNRL